MIIRRISIVLFVALANFRSVSTKKVFVLDSSEMSTLRWMTWSNTVSHPGSSNEEKDGIGWLEESVVNLQDGTNTRSYVTCDVQKEHADSWLRMNFAPRASARRLSIEMVFTMRDCKQFPHTARTCKETFSLLYHETDDDSGDGPKDAKLFQRIDRITADAGRFSEPGKGHPNTEIRTVPVTKKGVYFAFRDEGACISLLNVRIFYDVCEEYTTNFAWFPETPVGPTLTSIQEAVGRCVDNASPPSGAQPKYVCKADGSWDLLSGGCQCNPGFKADSQRCIACDVNMYKDVPGFGLCQSCPDHSRALTVGTAVCQCEAGYYRSPSDSPSKPCTRPPSRPENPQILSVDQSSAVISWTKPSNFGGRNEIWYRIECRECPSNAQYQPAKSKFNATKVTLINLEPSTVYTVFIYAENDVSSQIDALPMYAVVEIVTKDLSPMQITNLKIDSISENQIALSWDSPTDAGGGTVFFAEYDTMMSVGGELNGHQQRRIATGVVSDFESTSKKFVQYYQIKQTVKDWPSNVTVKTSNEGKITMQNLMENVEYVFEVRPFTSKGWGTWSDPKVARTAGRNLSTSGAIAGDHKTPVLITLVVFVLIIVIICAVTAAVLRGRFFCKASDGEVLRTKKHCSDLDALEYNADLALSPDYNTAATLNRKLTVPLMPSAKINGPAGFRPYVDPTTYEDPTQALKDFANEIDANDVIIEEIIGSGEFGDVCKGKMRLNGGAFSRTVAIKTLKPGSSEKAKLDFLTEASIMGQFDHPNVIKLVGVVTKLEPVMIITDYMENRSLDRFLRANDLKLNVLQLVTMLRGVAQGMKYLSDKSYVHRDLAARNVLVDAQLNCKIADFGLSRTLDGSFEQAYTTRGGKIPVRWTAPEAITYRKFTSASDVWSYGVVMWEVVSYGQRPYDDWSNQDVIQAVERGYRLPAPMDCPINLYRLMLECWNRERQSRPTFASICLTLNNYLLCPELLQSTSGSSSMSNSLAVQALVHNPNNYKQNMFMKTAGVDDLLRQIGLYEKYSTTFHVQGIKTMLELSHLSKNEFSAWGVRKEDQEKIFDALQYMQQQRRQSTYGCVDPTFFRLENLS